MEALDLLVASTNLKKLEELKKFLSALPIRLVSLRDFPEAEEVEENGKTFEENAILKARGYAVQTGLLTLAEDSGLCCDALDGAPGIYSARFAGTHGRDIDNNQKLLKLMEKLPDNCRQARFVSAVALAEGDRVIGTAEGEVHGYIGREMKGTNGFGYDSVFYYPPFDRHFGQVAPGQKAKVSHRTQALKKAKVLLEDYLSQRKK